MLVKYDLLFILLLLSTFLVLLMGIYIFRMKNKQQIHYVFLVNMILLSVWSISRVIQIYVQENRQLVIFLEKFVYVGCILVPISLLYTGIIFAKTKIKFSLKQILLFIIPIISLIMVFTNEYHNLFIEKYSFISTEFIYGKYYIIHEIYSYLLIFIGLYFLIFFSIKNSGFFSKQSLLIFIGILFPFIVIILSTQKVVAMPVFIENISFSFLIICFMFAIFKYQFLNVVPIALQRIVDLISDSYIVINENYDIIDYNKSCIDTFEGIVSIKRKDSLIKVLDSNEFLDTEEFIKYNEISKKEKRTVSFEKHIESKMVNKYFFIEVTPIISNNDYLGTIYLLKDITEHKKNIEMIKNNQKILMERERLASLGQLIGGIAHNLKTPIMSIAGAIEGLRDLVEEYEDSIGDPQVLNEDHKEIASEMKDWLNKMKPYCSYMSDVISAVKGQAVTFNTSISTGFTLNELVKRIQILMKHELIKGNCILNLHSSINLNEIIKGDINSLVQIFDNIIANSIYAYNGNHGEIDFYIDKKDNNYIFTITDYAAGIDDEIKNRLLKEMITTKGTKGTGLGLYMSSSTIKGRFGGEMWFDSEMGKGTSFYISIPCV